MIKIKSFLIALIAGFILDGCSTYKTALPTNVCHEEELKSKNFENGKEIQAALEKLVHAGVPGSAAAIYSEEKGWWISAAGYAKIEDQIPMKICHLQYLQSISKTYMAVAVLKLHEQGSINLDHSISKYLPIKYSKYITDVNKISVRMLLNHTSGIPEYNFSPRYVTTLLQHPSHDFTGEDYLKYIDGRPLDFEPGSRYSYRNTNYMLLALLTDAITGNHAEFIERVVINPLNLTHTYYRNSTGYLNYPNLVNAYWDRYSNGIVENVSKLQQNNVASLIGDDGIVTTPKDAVLFLKGLLEGRLLSANLLLEMKTWITNHSGEPRYGLGIGHTKILDQIAIGHSGGGIGAGAELRYFPEKKLYMFVAINLGTVTGSPLHIEATKARDHLYKVILNQID